MSLEWRIWRSYRAARRVQVTASAQSNRKLVVASVMGSMFMVAIEATIITTAMPQIVADLGGLPLYSWVFSSFLLAQTALTVVFGSLSDIYGRKSIMLAGIAIFVLGSIVCGFAWSMPIMIIFRLIQGIGAGAMQPVAMTIIADLYPGRERGKVQGYLASVWAISAVLGPIAGGLIIRHFSWAWVFWINVPIGMIAAAGFIGFLHEKVKHERHPVDIIGAATFTIAVTSVLIGLEEMNSSAQNLIMVVAIFVLSTAAFIFQERRSAAPLVSFALWSHRPVATANGVALLSGMALMGLTTFVPIYVQLVLHRSPVVAGLALTTMLVGWPAGATLATRLFHRFELQRLLLAGALLQPIGAALIVLLTPQSSPLSAAMGSLIMGFGMGLISVSSMVLIQEIVDPRLRGGATASILFSRNLGSTLGATVLGAVLNHGLARATGGASVTSEQLRQLLETQPGEAPGGVALRLALQHSLNLTFWTMLGMTLLTIIVAWFVPTVSLKHPLPVVSTTE
jgi:EmrB/QacA subfamily drug resistance transporter